MLVFDKAKIKEELTEQNIFDLLDELGGNPEMTSFGIVSATICHNPPNEGSRKLYYYQNSNLFHCYTGCDEPNFDIFDLVIKVAEIQWKRTFSLNDAVRWIAHKFHFSGEHETNEEVKELIDWQYLSIYDRVQDITIKNYEITLKEYDSSILDNFNYNIKLTPWLNEGIAQTVLSQAQIGFYPGGDQITIPHFDKNGRFIGLRGRTLCAEDGERYGKYRPLKINGLLYNHPLGMNLYNFNNSKEKIQTLKKAIIFESEKSTLKYQSYFGMDSDISVACCGSSISEYQMQMLLSLGVQEVIIAFDRQFLKIGDKEFNHLKNNLIRLRNKYKNYTTISFIFDKKQITQYKSSPVDEGPEKFLQLYKERIIL